MAEGLLKEQMARLGGVPTSTATAAMFLIRFATLWFAVVVGFVALGLLRARYPALNPPDPTRDDAKPPGGEPEGPSDAPPRPTPGTAA